MGNGFLHIYVEPVILHFRFPNCAHIPALGQRDEYTSDNKYCNVSVGLTVIPTDIPYDASSQQDSEN